MKPHLYGKPLMPAQLIGTGLYFVLFVILLTASNVLAVPGAIGVLYLSLHPVFRVLHERFRKDDRGRAFHGLTCHHTPRYVCGGSPETGVLPLTPMVFFQES